MLKDKVAVIYGAGGAIGGAVARAFASEGANLFLTGRLRAPVDAVAKDIVSAGGSADAAEVDALDEQTVDKHLQSVIDKAGRVDISFNAVGIPDTRRLRSGAGRQGGTHSRAIRRARTPGHSRGRSATTRHAGDKLAEGSLRRQGKRIGQDLGTVPRAGRKYEPRATGHDARGDGKHGGLHGVR
jgi:NAD(P)-dependent dehydrogenase (short-subunit alcohol dehydrogenase family)